MATVHLDSPDLPRWAGVLAAAGAQAMDEGYGIVSKGSLNIKTTTRRLAPHGAHTPHYENSINYDVTAGHGWIEGEIGPVEGRLQRGLGNLLEYGGPYNDPHPHHEPALDEEEPRFYQQCEDMAARLLERYG